VSAPPPDAPEPPDLPAQPPRPPAPSDPPNPSEPPDSSAPELPAPEQAVDEARALGAGAMALTIVVAVAAVLGIWTLVGAGICAALLGGLG
jgi:hypothetical protein